MDLKHIFAFRKLSFCRKIDWIIDTDGHRRACRHITVYCR